MKKLLVAVILSALAWALPAFDMGFKIDNASTFFYSRDLTLAQGDTATLWARFDAPEVGRLDIAGIYDFLYTRVWAANPVDIPEWWRFDVEMLRWSSVVHFETAVLSYELGRRPVRDLTGWTYDSKMDGLRAALAIGGLSLWGGLDFTGLVLKKNSKVSVTNDDVIAAQQRSEDFAPPRLVANLGVNFAELVLRQDLGLELSASFDLRAKATDPISTGELGFRFSGPVLPGLREQLFGVLQLVGSSQALEFAFLAGFKLVYNLPLPGASLALDALYASGRNGSLAAFTPTAGKTISSVMLMMPSNYAALGLDFSVIPWIRATAGVKLNGLFKTTVRDVSLSNFNNGSTGAFLGLETLLYATWDISPELSWGLNGGVFIPNAGDTFKSGTPLSYMVALTLTLKV